MSASAERSQRQRIAKTKLAKNWQTEGAASPASLANAAQPSPGLGADLGEACTAQPLLLDTLEARVLEEHSDISDHLPIFVRLQIKEAPGT